MTVALGTKGAALLVAVAEGSCIGLAGAGGEQNDGGRFGVSRPLHHQGRPAVNAYGPPRAFPGILYAGDGMRLAGDGPNAFTDAQGDTLPFKAVIHGSPPRPDAGSDMKMGDRIWVLPDSLGTPPEVPAQLLLELAEIIKDGGQVGLAARDGAEGARMRDMLVLLLSPPEGQA